MGSVSTATTVLQVPIPQNMMGSTRDTESHVEFGRDIFPALSDLVFEIPPATDFQGNTL